MELNDPRMRGLEQRTIEVLEHALANRRRAHNDAPSLLAEEGSSGTLHCAPKEMHASTTATGTAMGSDDDGNTRVLPSGLVTFVFTDIEASTRLYKTIGEEAAGLVFDQHNIELRAAWTSHGGHEVHTEGDSFFVVFEDPNAAVAACADVQRRLAATNWPEGGEVRVRIGVHCGLAAPRNDDYMALAVHQAARVMSAANGGQILVSDAIVQLLEPGAGITIVRTGSFRLRDFDEAPALYRIDVAPTVTNDRPPRATPANHHNLVPRLTSFIGREADVVSVNGLIERGKAVTIVGLGGMGKTRLATEVGLEVAPTWDSGVWMVELAEVVDPELIAEEVATSIGVDSASVGDRWHDVIEFVGDKSMLLVFDNVEHLIDHVADLVPRLLRACPNCAVLSTSREPLNCQGEVVYRLQPLELSFETDNPIALPSVELFIDRARTVHTQLELTPAALEHVLEICRHLDGLPLAIEIAAAQVNVLQLAEIRDGLNNRFRLLRSRDRTLPERQRTVEGLLGWSYQLLSDAEQRAFRRLAVFAGSFSIDAAEAALSGDGLEADDVPELIWALVDKSLIAADLSDSATRYRLLESVQQYAMRLHIDNDDPLRTALALGNWQLEKIAPWLVNDRKWLGETAIELANVRNVVDLLADAQPEMAQQLMCSIGRYRDTVQSYQVGIDELKRAAVALPLATPSRVALLAETAHLCLRMARTEAAAHLLDEAASLQELVGPPFWNDVAIERAHGEMAIRAGSFQDAIQVARNALDRDITAHGSARMWSIIGIAESSRGELENGLEALETALGLYVRLGDAPHLALAHANVAEAAWRSELYSRAAEHQRYCLEDAVAIGQLLAIGTSLTMASYLAGLREEWTAAIAMYARAEAMQQEAGHQPYAEEASAMQRIHAEATANLGTEEVAAARVKGRDMPVLDAVELAFLTFDREIARARPISNRTNANQ